MLRDPEPWRSGVMRSGVTEKLVVLGACWVWLLKCLQSSRHCVAYIHLPIPTFMCSAQPWSYPKTKEERGSGLVVVCGGIEPSLRVQSKRNEYEAKAINSHEGDGGRRGRGRRKRQRGLEWGRHREREAEMTQRQTETMNSSRILLPFR